MENLLDEKYKEGQEYILKGDISKGLEIINDSAKLGHIDSQRGLGIAYMFGEFGLEKDIVKAIYWFNQAKEQNDSISFYNLGCIYYTGDNVEKNINLGIEYIQKAADLGFADAQRTMGSLYYNGENVEFNRELAEKYFLLAINNGDKHSAFMLGTLNIYVNSQSNNLYSESKKFFEKCNNSPYEKMSQTIINLLNKAYPKAKDFKKWALGDLLDKLHEEDNNCAYYRGQTNFYGNPLRPSIFRCHPHSSYPIIDESSSRLRKLGKQFYFEDSFNPLSISQRMKRRMARYINNSLGYVFTQTLFQQAGYTSEGLDVTSDINVALFFSTFDYDIQSGNFYIDESKEYSVLYRWENLNCSNSENILNYGYFDCPNLIPTYDIFKSFDTCDTAEEFYESLHTYTNEICWGKDFDLLKVIGNRPLHLIKFPKLLLDNCRVIRQKAALIIGDTIMSEPTAKGFINQGFNPPAYMKNLPYRLVQDLSEDGFCDIYIYKRDNELAKKVLNQINLIPSELYNEKEEDLSHLLLYGWVETVYKEITSFGTIPIELNYNHNLDLTYMDIMTFLKDWSRKKRTAGYYFEQ